ncbi:hypothetical protein FA13DRAFT_1790720 [Coprinellus micaceus]|uniref:Uncharacterized protein n=1 Tax=Coprinellus micaceus TaxID=71717 RepID=A0A4Y7TE14_COPMI|nr:hypothetical protein FA13DRAFT_1790720 [Coprinellus micaceus]
MLLIQVPAGKKGKAVHVTPSSTSPGSWASSRSTLSPTSSSGSRLSVDLSLYDPTPAFLEALPSEAGDLNEGRHFWVYGYPVSSLSGLATLNWDVFKRKEPVSADTEEETKLDLWSGTCDLIANLRMYTAYPDVHLALVEGRSALIGVDGEGEGGSEATLVMWAISLACAKGRGKYEGRPTIGHLRKLEPILGRPCWFEALKDRKTFCFEV